MSKGRQDFVDIDEQNIALFIAKQKVRAGMQNVLIQVNNTNDNARDTSVAADVKDIEGEK